jgi:hypothetical protein
VTLWHRGPVLGARGGPLCHRGVAPDATPPGPRCHRGWPPMPHPPGPGCHRGWPPLPHYQELFQEFPGNFTSPSQAAPAGRGTSSTSTWWVNTRIPAGRMEPGTVYSHLRPLVGPCQASPHCGTVAGAVSEPARPAMAYRVHDLTLQMFTAILASTCSNRSGLVPGPGAQLLSSTITFKVAAGSHTA